MKQKLDCDIIRDLLPAYIEDMNSEASNKAIREHLESCKECRQVYDDMKKDIRIDKAPNVKKLKKYLNKAKLYYAMIVLGILGLVGVVTCLIVNLAVEKRLSWSLIVTGAVGYAAAVVYTFIRAKKDKLIKTTACISILNIPFLALVQVITYNIMEVGDKWFIPEGIEISFLWIAVVWSALIIYKIFKLNPFYSLGVLIAIGIVGSVVTQIIVGSIDYMTISINSGINLILAVVFIVIGYMFDKKRKNKEK